MTSTQELNHQSVYVLHADPKPEKWASSRLRSEPGVPGEGVSRCILAATKLCRAFDRQRVGDQRGGRQCRLSSGQGLPLWAMEAAGHGQVSVESRKGLEGRLRFFQAGE